MNKFLFAAQDGSTGATKTLDDLNVSIEQLQGMTVDQKFELFADRLASVADPGDRAALAMQVFGKGAVDLLPLMANGAAGIRELRDDADKLGLTITDVAAGKAAQLNDALDRMTSSTKGLVFQFAEQLAPIVTDVANSMAYFVGNNQDWIRTGITLVSSIGAVAVALKTITLAQQAYAKAAAVAQALSGPKGWIVLAAGIAAAAAVTYELNAAFDASNARMEWHQAKAAATAAELDGLTEASDRASSALWRSSAVPAAAPEYLKYQLQPELPPAKFDSESLKRYQRDAANAVEALAQVQAKRDELTAAFRDQSGRGGAVTVDMLEGLAFHEVEVFRAAKAASEFAAGKIAESTAAAIAAQTKLATAFAGSFTTLKASLLTNAESSRDEFKAIFDSWAAAGSQTKVRYEEMVSLQAKFAENRSGITDQFTALNDELRILRGEITATELEFEKLGQFGVGDKQIQKLKELRAERDGLQKENDQTVERKQNSDDKLKTLTATRDGVLESLMTPVEKSLAEFKTKAADVNAAVSAGLLDPAKAVAYLADEQKRLSEGFVGEKFKQASNTGIDARGQQANNLLVDLVNRRGGPPANNAKDQQTELQRAIAKESARTANEIAGMRLEALRREQLTTRPWNQRTS